MSENEKEAVVHDDFELNGDGDASLELTPQEHRRLRRIIDWRILPYFSLLYLLSKPHPLAVFVHSILPTSAYHATDLGRFTATTGFLDRVNTCHAI